MLFTTSNIYIFLFAQHAFQRVCAGNAGYQFRGDEMGNVKATWHISLDCICPKCEAYLDITNSDDELFYRVHPAQDKTDYEVTCPLCQHEFLIDTQY